MYSFHSRVRYSELNHEQETLSCSSIINYFQDCSTFQSEDLNLGIQYLESIHRVWILNGWQVEIYRPIRLGENLLIGTWPYAFKGFYGYRNFVIKNDRDEILAAANSIWVYMNTETGKPMKVPDNNAGYTLEPAHPLPPMQRKIELPEHPQIMPAFAVKKSNIDSYHHVNNGQHVKLAEEFLPSDFQVSSFRVEYRMQAVLGDLIIPQVENLNDRTKVVLSNQDNLPFSISEFTGSQRSKEEG